MHINSLLPSCRSLSTSLELMPSKSTASALVLTQQGVKRTPQVVKAAKPCDIRLLYARGASLGSAKMISIA